jgi:hypothetical protein
MKEHDSLGYGQVVECTMSTGPNSRQMEAA